jgi:hypothetical protein
MIDKIFSQIKYRFFEYPTKTSGKNLLTTEERLTLALTWFRNSLLPEGGASALYSMMMGTFKPGYPLATAGWIPTLSRVKRFYPNIFKDVFGDDDILSKLAHWVIRTQRRDGTFPGNYGDYMNQAPRIFNNGVIIHGLLDYYNSVNEPELLLSARRSADWLLKVQSQDGSWRQFTLHQLSSNTLTASALIRLGDITGEKSYNEAGEKNIRFALSLQLPNGYLSGNGFTTSPTAYTVTIGYALEGILEAGILTGSPYWKEATLRGLIPVLNLVRNDGFLYGEIDEQFHSTSSYCCLQGNCQLAIIALKLASLKNADHLRDTASLMLNYVASKQLNAPKGDLSGGVTGSWPISGNYSSYEIPSWTVRYFVEALMIRDSS